MPIRMFHIGFNGGNPGFPKSDLTSRYFSNPTDKIVYDINESNVLMIGNFINNDDMQIILTYTKTKILYIGEPITKFNFCYFSNILFQENKCDYYFGVISNKSNKWIKCPFYIYDKFNFQIVNEMVATTPINNKRFCCLINSHDIGNTRLPILTKLSKYGHVDCPGKLANNCSPDDVTRVGGNIEYIKQFVFNICSENFGASHPGYITEKLINCVSGGAIPIYYGELDEVDNLIFNKDRILFLNSTNESHVAEKVNELLLEPSKLESFYKQPVFMDTAEDTIKRINADIFSFFKQLSAEH